MAAIVPGVGSLGGIMSMPPSIAPTFMPPDLLGARGIFQVALDMVLVEVRDATSTLIGVAKRAGLLTEGPTHSNPNLGRALLRFPGPSRRNRCWGRDPQRPVSKAPRACRRAAGRR